VRVTREEIAEMESRYFPNSSPGGLFRRCKVYLDRYSTVGKQETVRGIPLIIFTLCHHKSVWNFLLAITKLTSLHRTADSQP
jgi:hypothetical protein